MRYTNGCVYFTLLTYLLTYLITKNTKSRAADNTARCCITEKRVGACKAVMWSSKPRRVTFILALTVSVLTLESIE